MKYAYTSINEVIESLDTTSILLHYSMFYSSRRTPDITVHVHIIHVLTSIIDHRITDAYKNKKYHSKFLTSVSSQSFASQLFALLALLLFTLGFFLSPSHLR